MDQSCRVVVVASGLEKVFSAGHNLKDMDGADEMSLRQLFRSCAEMMITLGEMPQVVIAQVRGVATAAGCQLVASCDLAVASSCARFATPGVNLGLFCTTPAVAVGRVLAPKHAAEMLLTGAMFGADHAFRIGLVNRVVSNSGDANLETEVHILATTIASKSAAAIRQGKAAYRAQMMCGSDVAGAYSIASEAMVKGVMDADATEGIAAFFEKREPKWSS